MILSTLLLLSSMTCIEQEQLAEMAMISYQFGINKEDIFFDEYLPDRLKIIDDVYKSNLFYKTHEKNRAIVNYSKKIKNKCEVNS